jgi:16S rRNA processing protein RimM
MNKSTEPHLEPLVAVARAVKTRGLKGEIVADLLTDFPERFETVSRLIAVAPSGEREAVKLEDHWFQKGRVVLKLTGCDSIEAASRFIGYEFTVPESERVPLVEGSFYQWELEGCRVETVQGENVGPVSGVLRTGGTEMLVIEGTGKEYLVPIAESIVVDIDVANKRILIDPPEGLLDL